MSRSLCILAAAVSSGIFGVGCAESVAPHPSTADVSLVCAGIADAQARSSLKDLRDGVDRVEVARETTRTKPFVQRSVGADIHIRAKQGMTAQWLARVVDCHVVSEAASHAFCTTAECPLGLDRVTTTVSGTPTGFTVAIRSNDSAVAREIARRSQFFFDTHRLEAVAATP